MEKTIKYLTVHWTAGGLEPNATDLEHYHHLVDGLGHRHRGRYPATANVPPLRRRTYAMHTAGANSRNLGVAMCGMAGSGWGEALKGKYGPNAITSACLEGTINLLADLCFQYDIPATPEFLLGHEEWDSVKGRPQDRWDVCCIPSLDIRPKMLANGTYASMNYIRGEVQKLLGAGRGPKLAPLPWYKKRLALWAFRSLYGLTAHLGQDTKKLLNKLRARPEFEGLN